MRVRDVARADARLVEWGYCAWWEQAGIRRRVFLLAGRRVQPFGRARRAWWRARLLVAGLVVAAAALALRVGG